MNGKQVICGVPLLNSTDLRVTVGRYTYGDPKFLLWDAEDRIDIGSFCSIAQNVTIFGGGEHNVDWITTYPLRIAFGHALAGKDGHPKTKGKTTVGNDVWVGFGAVILSGVTVGDGAVIGAGSVVTKDVPPYAIVAGNPARLIRYRFDGDIRAMLLQIAWWNWPLERIEANVATLCSPDVETFSSILSADVPKRPAGWLGKLRAVLRWLLGNGGA